MPGENACILQFVKLTEKAFAPVKLSVRAAGFDLLSAYDLVIPAKGKGLVKTDIQIKVPKGSYGRIAPRSGLALKNHIDVGAGVIDEDYRGNVGVVLFNHSNEEFAVKRGDRVAQLVCEKIYYPTLEEVESCGFWFKTLPTNSMSFYSSSTVHMSTYRTCLLLLRVIYGPHFLAIFRYWDSIYSRTSLSEHDLFQDLTHTTKLSFG